MEKLGKLEAIAFDFDGTLAELIIDFRDMKRKLKALGSAFMCDMPDRDELPALEWVDYMSARISEDYPDLGREFHTRCRFLIISMEVEAARHGKLFPFTRSILESLHKQGIKTAIITRNTASAVRQLVPDIDKITGCFLSREDVEKVKPHPEQLFKALEIIEARPENSLMVGDFYIDIETGKNAGAMTAAVASGMCSIEELKESEPDFIAADCEELMTILRDKKFI